MINKLWTDVSLENYNNWYPLTGKITETPQQYIKTWPNVNDWFKTFAIRAQNDINAYLDFILSKFPFDIFKDELIKETLRDMVYVMVEHWVFNRTPIEFNVDATIQFNNGSQFSANSTPTINVWDLAPSRMKIWARLTELKQVFLSYNDDEIDVEKIDLKAFYTRNQVDELIKEQKEFTLSKQIKLYDDLVNDNENEIYRGPVSKFINKGYVATDYDKETETMILDWPDEIGTLPPEALQNNPQIGDYTHAPTCDFSAKQQKRITTNENEITKLNTELIKANENINDVKNNWFNIETSPLWKKVENNNIEIFKWYFIKISYQYSTENNFMKFYKVIKIYLNNVFNEFELLNVDSMTYSEQIQNKIILNTGTIYYNNKKKKFSGGGNSYPERGKINLIGDIKEIYQYQGIDTPTEFIAEESTERDYYTKLETNNLLDKKQDKLIAGENIKIDENNKISATAGKTDLSDYYKKSVFMKGYFTYKDDRDQLWINDSSNSSIAISLLLNNTYGRLETTNKSIVGAINENKTNIDKKQDKLLLINENVTYGELKYNKLPEGKFGDDLGIPPNKIIKEWISESVNKKQDKIENLQDKIFNNKDDKDSTTRLVNEVIKTNVGGKTLIYRNNPNITDDLDIPNKKYIDDKIPNLSDYYNKTDIDKKLADFKIIKWKVIGNRVNDKKWHIPNAPMNQYIYRVFVTWEVTEENPLNKGYQQVIFFKSPQLIGTGNWRIASGKIGNSDATLNINFDNTDWSLTLNGGNGGAIISLEVLEQSDNNVYQINSKTLNIIAPEKIDIEKPIKINSYSLETNEIRENEWDIELKNNPTPNIPQWKEVGIREKNKWDNWQITYDFQENKHYRIYYSWSIYNPVYTIQEFIITDKKIAGVQIQTFNDSANIVILSVQHAKLITIYTGKGNLKGNVWKLEELQE